MRRPRAEFVNDVTIPDGYVIQLGETQVINKVWSLRNSGKYQWPQGCALKFISGDLIPHGVNGEESVVTPVPPCGPDCIVHISADIQVPQKVGRYRGSYRLVFPPENKRFGPRIWIDVQVIDKKSSETKQETKQNEVVPTTTTTTPTVASPSAAIPFSETKDAQEHMILEAASASSDKPVPASASSATGNGNGNGNGNGTTSASASSSYFQYENELQIICNMGFGNDKELLKYLLVNNKGDVTKVVSWLINHDRQ
jgi:hypothetical protein